MPSSIPVLSRDEIDLFRQKSYPQIALDIIRRFIGDEIALSELERMVAEAYNLIFLFRESTGCISCG